MSSKCKFLSAKKKYQTVSKWHKITLESDCNVVCLLDRRKYSAVFEAIHLF